MKKVFLIPSIVLNIGLVTTLAYCLLHQPPRSISLDSSKPTTRIAILTPVSHPSLEKIEQGFKKTMTRYGKKQYEFSVFNANGNKQLMRAQAEEIVQSNYDLIFSIATQPTQLLKELCDKKQKKTPLVFAAASEPERLGIVKSLQNPSGNATGVVEDYALDEQIKLLQSIKPNIKKILLVYNPTQSAGLETKKQILEKILTARGIKLNTVEVYATNEVYAKCQPNIQGNDVVMVLKDNTVVAGIDGLIKLCSMHGVTLFTSDLDSGDKGAAISFGVHEEQFGEQGAQLALKILEENANPATLACRDAGAHKIKINTRTMQQQGMSMAHDQVTLFQAIEVI